MSDLLLTHGFYLADDEIERRILKPYPPLGLLYLSAYLKRQGFAVDVRDTAFRSPEALAGDLAASSAPVAGIYTTHMTRRRVVKMISEMKAAGKTVIAGGPDCMNYAAEYLRHGTDVIVAGEGEATVAELLAVLPHRGPQALHGIAGTIFRDGTGAVIANPPRPLLPVDSLPWPDREAVDIGLYLQAWAGRHATTSLNVITGRGCPFGCHWCSHPVFGKSHRQRLPGDCADEVQWLNDRYQPGQLWYADDVFTLDRQWIEAYADELQRRQIHIPFETITRADRLQDGQLCQTLAKMACRRLWIGSESGSDRMLRAMNRGATAEQVRRAISLAQAHGISVGVFLMWGYEGETVADIEATVEHIAAAQPDEFFTTVVYPSPGTAYFQAVEPRIIPPSDWAEASDRDYHIAGRPPRAYYRLADQWLRAAVASAALAATDREQAHMKREEAAAARQALLDYFPQPAP